MSDRRPSTILLNVNEQLASSAIRDQSAILSITRASPQATPLAWACRPTARMLDVYPAMTTIDLPIAHYRARLRASTPLRLGKHHAGTVLRGAFGLALHQALCPDMTLACAACPARAHCAYPAVFDPGARGLPIAIKRLHDPPRPFVLRPADSSDQGPLPERPWELDLVIAGSANAHAPILLATLSRFASNGLGRARVPLTLEALTALNASGAPLATRAPAWSSSLIAPGDLLRPGDLEARRIRVHFVTPTSLRERGRPIQTPTFGLLIRRLRGRIGALATLYGPHPIDDDLPELFARGDAVSCVRAETRWSCTSRRSTRTGHHHELDGFLGTAEFTGDLKPFMPLLRLGELLHVGRHATFGHGRILVDVLE